MSVPRRDGVPDLGRWVEAGQLEPGMFLRTSTGTWVQITAIDTRRSTERVYNLTVDGVHTHYVTAGGTSTLTHNCPTYNVDGQGRPGGAEGTITSKTTGGTTDTSKIKDSGVGGFDPDQHQKGHLFGAQLGGSNTDTANFVAQFNRGNNPWQRLIENEVRGVADSGEDVFYRVTPQYLGNSKVPFAMTFHARGSNGYNLDVTLKNQAGMPRLTDLPTSQRPSSHGGLRFGSRR